MFQEGLQDASLHLVVTSPQAPLGCGSFDTSLVFDVLDILRSTDQLFIEFPLILICLMYFSCLDRGSRFWGGRSQTNFITSHWGTSYRLATQVITADAALAEVTSVSFLHCSYSLPHFHTWEGSHHGHPTPQGWELCSRCLRKQAVSYLNSHPAFSLEGNFSPASFSVFQIPFMNTQTCQLWSLTEHFCT